MEDLWQYFKNLFKAAEKSTPTEPLVHEVIDRTAAEQEDYQLWSKTLAKKRLLNWLQAQYIIYTSAPQSIDESLDFLDTPSAKGFVIHVDKTYYPKREIIHFFDYLKERVLILGYYNYVSDSRTYTRQDKVEMIQRHYLKPSNKNKYKGPKKARQAYGNIMIELLLQDEVVKNLKFSAMTYSDHKFETALEFSELMEALSWQTG